MDFSLLQIILHSSLFVKLIILVLFFLSIRTVSIILMKFSTIKKMMVLSNKFETNFWNCRSLNDFFEQIGKKSYDPLSSVFVSVMKEVVINNNKPSNNLQERIEKISEVVVIKEVAKIENGLSFLAMTSNMAPFIGLLGMVWDVMTSFQMIAQTNTVNAIAIAPNISGALMVTAIGLFVAITSSIGYNRIEDMIIDYEKKIQTFSYELISIIIRG